MIFSFVFLLLLEIYLRVYWGFCDSVLMMESKNYEYIPQPDQHRFRFRKHIMYNRFSMRSPDVDTSATKILGFGDSIINGGVVVDQDSLATTLLSENLSDTLKQKVQVLNISAGSWGPDNCYAYLMEKGNFNAKIIFLVVSSHDAHDNMDFEKVIDKRLRYESRQYKLAIWELIVKYGIPKLIDPYDSDGIGISKKGTSFNTGFLDLSNYCKENNIPFFVSLHPDKGEFLAKEYNAQGKEIIAYCKANGIECIQQLLTIRASDYRSGIHLNESGHRHMAENLFPVLLNHIKQ